MKLFLGSFLYLNVLFVVAIADKALLVGVCAVGDDFGLVGTEVEELGDKGAGSKIGLTAAHFV